MSSFLIYHFSLAAGDDLFGQPEEAEASGLFGASKKGGLFDDDEETESAAAAPTAPTVAPKQEDEPVTRERSGDFTHNAPTGEPHSCIVVIQYLHKDMEMHVQALAYMYW